MSNWRSTHVNGKIYRVTESTPFGEYRVKAGDLLLCLYLWGDCLHRYATLRYRTNNGYYLYFDFEDIVSGYENMNLEDAYPKMIPKTAEKMLELITSGPGMSLIIPCEEAEEYICSICEIPIPLKNKKVCEGCEAKYKRAVNGM